jgi:hypothetical protein
MLRSIVVQIYLKIINEYFTVASGKDFECFQQKENSNI